MKTKKICAVLLACMMMTSAFAAGCKKSDESSSSVSDTGISLSIDPSVTGSSVADPSSTTSATAGETSANGETTESSYNFRMKFEDNYDLAAINEMSKKCTVHGITYKEFDYNFYYANEYVGVMSSVMSNSEMMTQAGFINLDYKISETMTIRDYLNQTVETDLQGEAFLTAYAAEHNLTLPDDVIKSIEDEIKEAETNATEYNMTMDEWLQSYYGPTANVEALRAALQRYELANIAQKDFVEHYQFAEGENMLPTVYHVLYMTMDSTTGEDLPADQQEEMKKKAEALLASVTSLDDLKTKGEAAKAAGEAREVAQYTVERGQMVQEFEDWCFGDHKEGDKDIVKTKFGYHVMYFVGKQEASEEQKKNIALSKMQDDLTAAINSGEYNVVYS